MDFFRFCVAAWLLLGTFQNTIKTPKGRCAPWCSSWCWTR
jgi:hypothetical protein